MAKKKTTPAVSAEEDAPGAAAPGADIKRAVQLGEQIIAKMEHIASAEDELSRLKQDLFKLQMETLPALMQELGLKNFTLEDGSAVTLKEVTTASLPGESAIEKEKDLEKKALMKLRFEQALAYLRANKAEALIRRKLAADFGKDSAKQIKAALKALKALGIEAHESRQIHPMSLAAWVRERLAEGAPVDMDLLGVFNGNKAELKRPKSSVKGTDKAPDSSSFI